MELGVEQILSYFHCFLDEVPFLMMARAISKERGVALFQLHEVVIVFRDPNLNVN